MTIQINSIPQGYEPTQRICTDVETGKQYRMYAHYGTHGIKLIADDNTEAQNYYLSHVGQTIRINGKREVKLSSMDFYSMKEGEKATHTKFPYESRFRKV